MTGSDWRVYEDIYYGGINFIFAEPTYVFLTDILEEWGVDFWWFHIIGKIFCFIVFVKFFNKYADNIYLPMMLFLASFGFFLFIDCPFRNLLAIGIFLIGMKYLYERKFMKYYLICILAFTFHASAIITFIFPLCMSIYKVKTNRLVAFYIFFFVFLWFDGIKYILILLSLMLPTIFHRIDIYSGTNLVSGNLFSIGLILRIICLFFMLLYRDEIINKYDRGHFIFSFSYVYLILSLVAYTVPLLFRVAYFLSPFYCVIILYFISFLNIRNLLLVKLFYCIVCLTITYTTVSSVYYVPYTNIIPYIIKNQFPDYFYRSTYNFINTPMRENDLE